MSEEQKNTSAPDQQEDVIEKITWKAWVSLLYLIIAFSGAFAKSPGPLRALDFNALVGKFGVMTGMKVNFMGAGGVGARAGLLVAISLIPTVMLANGLIKTAQEMGALRAAGKLFQPLLKPLMGIPGICGIAFISALNSSDVASFMTKQLYDQGKITDDERAIFAAYQYAGSGTIGNTIGCGAPLMPIAVLPLGIVFLIIIVCKFIGANMVRIAIKFMNKKETEAK